MSSKFVPPAAPYSSARPYSSVAEPTEPTIRYFRPDSSECSRRMCVAHSTYSGIDNSSKPMNSTTRSLAATSTNMPRIEVSISAKYSPSPASIAATDRHDSNTAAIPPAQNTSVSARVRLSTTSARAMIASLMSHCQIDEPGGDAQRHQRQERHDAAADERRAREADQQHDARARGQRDARGTAPPS